VKTGRLLKFHRRVGEVHAYLYRDGPGFRASVYLMAPERSAPQEPLKRIEAATEPDLELAVRAYVDEHFPK